MVIYDDLTILPSTDQQAFEEGILSRWFCGWELAQLRRRFGAVINEDFVMLLLDWIVNSASRRIDGWNSGWGTRRHEEVRPRF